VEDLEKQLADLKAEIAAGKKEETPTAAPAAAAAVPTQNLVAQPAAGAAPAGPPTISSLLGGLSSAQVGMTLQYANLNQPQTVATPTDVRPFAQFTAQLRSIVGSIHGTGGAGSAVVLQANPFPFTGGFQIVGNPQLASATGTFQFDVGSVPETTEFRVVGVGSGQPLVSDTLTEFVQLAVTMTVARGSGGGTGTAIGFSGLIRPAEAGSRVSVQRLVGSRWMLVAATRSQPAATDGSSYAITLHLTHSGLYRVFAASVEGGHLANSSLPTSVHVHGAAGRRGSR